MAVVATELGRSNLPAELTSFVGRRRELADIRRLMAESRLVTLTGMGGVGKTRLARRVAESASRAFADGVWQVELADLLDPALLLDTVAAALGLRQHSATWTVETLGELIGDRHSLLLVDNCEHLVEACAVTIEGILKRCAHVHLLATSREVLGIAGERTYAVGSLSLPEPGSASVGVLSSYESVSLFVDRATAVCPTFAVDADNAATVADLCLKLDGVPLALELAAVWTRVLAPSELLAQLTEHSEILGKGLRTAPVRQQSLRALVDWSYQLCDADEQSLWRQAAVFAQGFELDALGQVVDGPRGLDLIEVVDRLASKSILFAERRVEAVRFRMPEMIRSYGLARLEEANDGIARRGAHLRWCLALAEQARKGWVSPAQLTWFTRIRRELPNIRAALAFALAQQGGERQAVDLIAALTDTWVALGFINEGAHWLDQATTRELPHPTRLTALRTRAILAALQGDRTKVNQTMDEALALAALGASDIETAWLTYASALAATTSGDPAALALMRDAIRRFREVGDTNGLMWALGDCAMAQGTGSNPGETEARVQEFLATAGPLGDRWATAYALWSRALACWRAGDNPGTARALRESESLSADFGDQLALGLGQELQAWIVAEDGDPSEAAALLGRAQTSLLNAGSSTRAISYLADGHARCEADLRARLGDKRFEAAFERGGRGAHLGTAATREKGAPPPVGVAGDRQHPLTRRESQVAAMVADGMSNREIAAKLVISPRTVDTHVENILVKLGCTSRGQVAAWLADRR